MLHSINKEQRLYVMPCGNGFTCYGFDVLDKRARALSAWYFEQNPQAIAQIPARIGTKKHFKACQAVIQQVGRYCTHKGIKCPVELSPQLKGLEGRRVEVVTMYGEKRRFIVGRSTGWLVTHLEIPRANSSGGMSAEKQYKSVTVIK
ncbi:hypothetical protein F9047_11585 [Escherichia coli]|nr:hypothetical protein F9047_11585 [Escherichia coli]